MTEMNYNLPVEAGRLNTCEFIKVMMGAHFHPPEQTDTSCKGYRNPYTGQPSLVCGECRWFSGAEEVK